MKRIESKEESIMSVSLIDNLRCLDTKLLAVSLLSRYVNSTIWNSKDKLYSIMTVKTTDEL